MTTEPLPAYTVRRSARARHVRLTVTPRDGLVVVVPERWRGDTDAIVAEKRAWAEAALARDRREARGVLGGARRAAAGHDRAARVRRGVAGRVPRDEGCRLPGALRRRRDRGDRQHRRCRGVPRGAVPLARPHGARAAAADARGGLGGGRASVRRALACGACARGGGRARRTRRSRSTATWCSCRAISCARSCCTNSRTRS